MTPRCIITGLFLSCLVGAAGPYIGIYLQGSNAGGVYYTSPVALFAFMILVGIANVLLGALHRPWVFQRGELVAIFIMMTLANAGLNPIHYWLGAITGPYYYATAENKWAELLQPYIPDWIAPHNAAAISSFYEGVEGGSGTIEWQVWAGPILYWLPFVIAFYTVTLCLMVVLRRQWMDRERLIYPIVQVPLAMVQDDDKGSLVKPFFRSWAMWIGCSLPMAIGVIRGLDSYYPYLPNIELATNIILFHDSFSIPLRLSFATLGFFFFIKREISFGLWAFFLLNTVQKTVYTLLGVGLTSEPVIGVWSYNSPSLVHQGMGGMIVLVLGGFYAGREHFANVLRKALWRAPDVDDSDEIISYRGAVLGLLGGLMVMTVWLTMTGIPVLGVFVFLFCAFVIFIALTRLVAEGGVAVIYPPMIAPDAALSAMGASFYGASGIMGLMFTRVWSNDILNFLMPHCANGLKLSEQIDTRRRWLFWAMILSSLAGLAGALWMVLTLTYADGGINLRYWNYVWMPNYLPGYTAAAMTEWAGPNWWGWMHTGVGATVMGLLMLARRVWVWWPLHPLGFPISSTFAWMASNAFLAWMLKGIILKYGGPPLYATIRPFFLGLIIGQFAICGIFWIIDAFTGNIGNSIFA